MSSVVASRGSVGGKMPNAPTVSSRAVAHPSHRSWRIAHPRRLLASLFAGLNQLLKLSDFSRGDVFRD